MSKKDEDCPARPCPYAERIAKLEVKMNIIAYIAGATLITALGIAGVVIGILLRGH
jgi:hypothetical protein